MTPQISAVAIFIAMTCPASAQMLDGVDDPAYRAAIAAVLAADDPAAVATLRDLAEAGNPAALVALPFALDWIPQQGSLAEKNRQRQVGGLAAQQAAALAHAATALWDKGRTDTPDDLVDRATGLANLAEPDKAGYLWSAWVNQTGGTGDLPEMLFSDATPAWVGASALTFRMGFLKPSFDDQDLLANLVRQDQLAAWMGLVYLTESWNRSAADLGDPVRQADIPADTAFARMEAARAVLAVSSLSRREMPVPEATAASARAALLGRAEFIPVDRLCRLHCPESRATCETAVLVYPGLPFGGFAFVQPFVTALDPDDFYASPRGLAALIPERLDPSAAADRAKAAGLDACYASVLDRRDSLSFQP